MCALRWTDIDPTEQDLVIERAYSVHRGIKTVKDIKTHQKRRLAVDSARWNCLARVPGAVPQAHSAGLSVVK
jgi:hypothetical protein